jgi:hypothetical protein
MSNEEASMTLEGAEVKDKEAVGVEKILELQGTEKYVFHGSRLKIDSLEPRVSNDTGSDPWQKTESVYADSSAKSAFERSLLDRVDGAQFYIDTDSRTAKIRCTREAYLQMMDRKVWVHVCDKKDFESREHGSECKSNKEVIPDQVIELGISDYEKLGGGFEIVD